MNKSFYVSTAVISGIALLSPSCVSNNNEEDERPNVLFFIDDDASSYHFSAYGCSWVNTPGFDKIASNGILFQNCYTPNAKSAPSRAVLLTGRYSWQLGTGGNHITDFPPEYKVFTEALRDNGYSIGYTGKGWAPGNSGISSDGNPRLLTGEPYQSKKLIPPTKFISDIDYSANFLDFLDHQEAGHPWFFWAGTREPHRKYEYGSGAALGGKNIEQIDNVPRFWPDNEVVRNDMLDYGYEIEYADKHLEIMISELERRGILDNTIIIVTADNGMPFPRAKANNYEYSHHQPLAIMWGKGIKNPGRVVKDYINFVDIAPTILDVCNISKEKSGMQEISGESIKEIFSSKKAGQVVQKRDYTVFGRERDDYGRPNNQGYPIRGIIRSNIMYIWNLKPALYPACNPETGFCEIDGSPTKTEIINLWRTDKNNLFFRLSMGFRPEEELYDLSKDIDCMNNLANDKNYSNIKDGLKKELIRILTDQSDPRLVGDADIFDKYPYYQKQDWNFYEKVISGEISRPWEITDWINPTDYDEYVYLVESGQIEPMKEKTSGLHW